MAKKKQIVITKQGIIFKAKPPLIRLLITLLARIGDGVIWLSIQVIQTAIELIQLIKKSKTSSVQYLNKKTPELYLSLRTFFHTIVKNFSRMLRPLISDIPSYFHKESKIFIRNIETMWLRLSNTLRPPPKIISSTQPAVIFKRSKWTYFFGFISGILLSAIIIFVPYNFYIFLKALPNPHLLSQRDIPVTTQIFDRNMNLLYEIHGDEDRKPLKLAEIPEIVKQSTIAIEDKEFYYHSGFSPRAIIRAAYETLYNERLQGGSTITQQLIKNALLTPEVTLTRKMKEVTLAFWAEQIYTKDEILEMYLNQVPYGGTAWGIEAASQMYFGKSIKEVTLGEAAYLAGLPAAPTLYSPYGTQPQLAKARQLEVLRRMVEDNYISQTLADAAAKEDIRLKPSVINIKAPHFVMFVREWLSRQFGQRAVDKGGLRIVTTLDLNLQEKTQQIVATNVAELARLKVGNGAAIITNPKKGEILAMVGSTDYFNEARDGNVNVVVSPRQPGSSIKSVTYAAALENGMTAASIIEDTPISFSIPGQPAYVPVNYDGRFHGFVTMRQALGNSYNIPAVKTLNRIGVKTLVEMGKRLGITTWNDDSRFGLALTLGGGEVTLLDMAEVYGTFANSGNRIDVNPILKVSDYTGRIYFENTDPKEDPVISPEIAFILSDILADNQARSQAFGMNSTLKIPNHTVAVKTGTTNDKRDNWTIGYTPDYVVGVWVGNNDNSPMDPFLTSGVTGAAPIWSQIMKMILTDKVDQPFAVPENVIRMPCFGRQEYFVRGTEPKNGCSPFPTPRNGSPKPTPR